MTTHDLLLIERARALDCTEWYEVDKLIKEAHTPEACERLYGVYAAASFTKKIFLPALPEKKTGWRAECCMRVLCPTRHKSS